MKLVFHDAIDWDYDVETPLHRAMGGSQSALCYLCVALAKRGHQVSLLTRTTNPRRILGVECYSANHFPAALLRDCDSAVVLNGPCNLIDQIQPMLGSEAAAVLWTQHAPDQPAMHALADLRIRDAWRLVVCVSDWHRSAMIDAYHIPPDRAVVARNAIAPRFQGIFRDRDDLTNAKAGKTILAYTSTPFRGLETLVRLFPGIKAQMPEAELRVYSSMGAYQVAEHRDEYRVLYDACRATPGIHYAGSIPQPQLAQELREATLLAYPNTFPETSCIAVMEAMAAGLHVVTSHLGALPETTQGLATLVKVEGTLEIDMFVAQHREAIVRVLKARQADPAGFLQRQWEQAKFVQETCNWDRRAEDWENLFGRLR